MEKKQLRIVMALLAIGLGTAVVFGIIG